MSACGCQRSESLDHPAHRESSDRAVRNIIVSKYADHCPLFRQSAILLRDAGIEITRATMCGWVMTF
jgi:hypothetical protein